MTNPFFIPAGDEPKFEQIAKILVNHAQGVRGDPIQSEYNHDHSPQAVGISMPRSSQELEQEAHLGTSTNKLDLPYAEVSKASPSPWNYSSWIPMNEQILDKFSHPFQNNETFDFKSVRKDFPILSSSMVWFDNAATTQKPDSVMQAMDKFLREENSNIHRGAHQYAKGATDHYENARSTVAKFIHAKNAKEIIFVRGCTEGINLVAHSFGEIFVQPGDEIVISYLEHHSNILPWQTLAKRKGARLRVIPIDKNGDINLEEYARLLSGKTKIVAITQVANSIGTVLPVEMMTKMAKAFGAHVLIDAAQSIPHFEINVEELGCDFLTFSGHKIYGPTGIGVVYGKETLLNLMQPYQTGGGMIEDVTFDQATYATANSKFEAGTPNVVGAIGLKAALDYVQKIGLNNIASYEKELTDYALNALGKIANLQFIGNPKERVSVISFVLEKGKTERLVQSLDDNNIALRIGHHCALPTMRFFGKEATIRPSFAFYNTKEEIDLLVDVISTVCCTE